MFLEETTFSTEQSAPVKVLCDAMALGGTTWSKTFHCPEGPWSPSWSWSLATFQHRARHKRMARIGSLVIMTCDSQFMMIIMCNSQYERFPNDDQHVRLLIWKVPQWWPNVWFTMWKISHCPEIIGPTDSRTRKAARNPQKSSNEFTCSLPSSSSPSILVIRNPFFIFKDKCATSPTLNQTSFHVYQIYFTRNVHYRQMWLGHTPHSISK